MTEAVDAEGAAEGATEGAEVLNAAGRCPEERVGVARGGRAGPNDPPSVVDRPRVRGRTAQGAEIGNRVAPGRTRSHVGPWARIRPRRRWFTAGEGTQQLTPAVHSGAEGARTPDLLGAIQALSQLSYSPVGRVNLETVPPPSNPSKLILSRQPPRCVVRGAWYPPR